MTELERLRAAYFSLCAHLRETHGVEPCVGTAGQVEAQHQRAHADEGSSWHLDAWRLPADKHEPRL